MCVIGVLQESRGKELQGSAQSNSVSLVLARNESPGTCCPGHRNSETSRQTAPRAIERLHGATGVSWLCLLGLRPVGRLRAPGAFSSALCFYFTVSCGEVCTGLWLTALQGSTGAFSQERYSVPVFLLPAGGSKSQGVKYN